MRAKKIQNSYLTNGLSIFLLLSFSLWAESDTGSLRKDAQQQQQKLLDKYGLLTNTQWSGYCDYMIADLVLKSFKQCLIIDADFPNAYSLAHGVVILTRGLLENIRNDDQLAHILAHEHAHITLNHHQQAVQLVKNPPKLFTKSRIKKFYRKIEHEADDEADKILLQHDFEPKQIHHYLMRIEKLIKESSADHEKMKDRIKSNNLPPERVEKHWVN